MNHELLRALCLAATPGPWFVCERSNDDGTVDIETGRIAQSEWPPAQKCEYGTAQYIAAMDPTTTLAMLDEIEKHKLHIKHIGNDPLRAENERLRGLLREAARQTTNIDLLNDIEQELSK